MCLHLAQPFDYHAIPEDWLEAYSETDDEKELEQHDNERANMHNQILAYMMEMR